MLGLLKLEDLPKQAAPRSWVPRGVRRSKLPLPKEAWTFQREQQSVFLYMRGRDYYSVQVSVTYPLIQDYFTPFLPLLQAEKTVCTKIDRALSPYLIIYKLIICCCFCHKVALPPCTGNKQERILFAIYCYQCYHYVYHSKMYKMYKIFFFPFLRERGMKSATGEGQREKEKETLCD